jgi:hypothetical protein
LQRIHITVVIIRKPAVVVGANLHSLVAGFWTAAGPKMNTGIMRIRRRER